MSLNFPVITVTGNLTGDPELRFTPTGQSVANFSVASNPRIRDNATGEWVNGETVFTRVVCWRFLAENVAESLRRGDPVIVTGRLQEKAYEDREGNKRRQHEILADAVGVSLDNRIVRGIVKVTRDAPPDSPSDAPSDASDAPSDAPPDGPSDAPSDASNAPSDASSKRNGKTTGK